MAGKPLRQEEVFARAIDVGDRRMPQRVEGVEPIESRLHLPGSECELDAALADTNAGLRAEEGIPRLQPFPPFRLVRPEFPEFTHQRIRQENVARPAALCDFGADSEAIPRSPLGAIDIYHVQSYNFGQP
jgi:hypothetical protein